MIENSFLKILVMGLPGSGKSTLSSDLCYLLNENYKCHWLNADDIRNKFNDWDFSEIGRERQAMRMKDLANLQGQYHDFVICDFVCPLQKIRDKFNADYTIFVNTITESRYTDTNKIFEKPIKFDYEVKNKNSKYHSKMIYNDLVRKLNKKV